MNLTFKQLEAFYCSATLGSFSAAASRLHTTQSAMSKRVGELEEETGQLLLHRTPKGLVVTAAGRRMLMHSQDALALMQKIELDFEEAQSLKGSLRLGVTELIALTWLPALIEALRTRHPALDVEPMVDSGVPLMKRLEQHHLDLIIIPGVAWESRFSSLVVGQVEEAWMASPDLRLPGKTLKPADFALLPVLEQSSDAAKHRFYESWRHGQGFQFGKVFTTNSHRVLHDLTVSGLGIAQLAIDYAREDIENGLLRIVRSDPMPPPLIYSAVYHRDDKSIGPAQAAQIAAATCDFSLRSDSRARVKAMARSKAASSAPGKRRGQ